MEWWSDAVVEYWIGVMEWWSGGRDNPEDSLSLDTPKSKVG
jgi:hypothetical protein